MLHMIGCGLPNAFPGTLDTFIEDQGELKLGWDNAQLVDLSEIDTEALELLMGEFEGEKMTINEMIEWLRRNDSGAWWSTVEDRIGMSDEDYAEHVAERYREARAELEARKK